MIRTFLILGVLLVTVVSGYGQDTRTVTIEPVTVRGQHHVRETALTHTVIDSMMLAESVNGSFSELLSRHTPVFIKTYGLGSTAMVAFRGTAASHTQVEWNGININNPMLGQVDFSLIPVWFVDQAELYHGGSSLMLGSGSLGGSVAMSSTPRWDKKFYGSVLQSIGSFGTYQTLVNVGGGNRKIQARVRYLYEQAENDFEFLNNAVLPFRREKQRNADYKKHGAAADLFWNAGRNNFLSLKGWFHHADRNLPPIMSYEGAGRTEKQKDNEFRLVGQWIKYGTKEENGITYKSELTSGFTSTRLDYFLRNETELGPVVNFDSRSTIQSFRNKYRFEWEVSKKTSLELLANFDHHSAKIHDHITHEGYKAHRNEAGLAVSAHHRFSPIVAGYVLLREELTDGIFSPLMPSLGLEFNPLREHDLSIKLNGTRNYHLPSLNDLYWLPGGNPDLRPERGYSTDISLEYGFERRAFAGKAIVTGFFSWIDDWIIWRPGEYRYWTAENIREVFARGIEASIETSYTIDRWKLGLHANYGFTRTTNEETDLPGDDSRGRQLIYIPVHKANIMFDASFRGFYLNYLWGYNSERFTTSSNATTRHTLPGYGLHNITVGKRIQLGKTALDLQCKVDNLFDKDYQAILWRAMPGRNYMFLAKFTF